MAVTMVVAFTGCGDSKKPAASDTEDTSNKEIEAADYYASVQKNAEIYKKYVTLGEYKGIEVEKKTAEVTDEGDIFKRGYGAKSGSRYGDAKEAVRKLINEAGFP